MTQFKFAGRLAKFVLVVALLLLILPEVIRFTLIAVIPGQGFGEAGIDDVDFNIFNGRVEISRFQLQREAQTVLSFSQLIVDVDWVKLLFGEIYLQEVRLDGVRLSVFEHDDGRWQVVLPLSGNDQGTEVSNDAELPRFGVESLQLNDVEIVLNSQTVKGVLHLEQLSLSHLSSWQNEQAELTLVGAWNDASLALDLTAMPLDPEPRLQGSIQLSRFALGDLAPLLGQPISGSLEVELGIEASRHLDGAMTAALSGKLSVDTLAAEYRQESLTAESLLWQGSVELGKQGAALSYVVSGDLQSSDMEINDLQEKVSLLAWESFSLSHFSLDQQLNFSVVQLRTGDLDAVNDGEEERGRFYTGGVAIDDLALLEGKILTIKRMQTTDGQYQLIVSPDGQLQMQTLFSTVMSRLNDSEADTSSTPATDVAELDGASPAVAEEQVSTGGAESGLIAYIQQFELVGDSYILLTDQRFKVPVQQRLNIKQLSISEWDQRHPDVPAKVKLLGSLGEFSAVEVSGEIKPFAEKLGLDIKGSVDAISLPDLSPYSEAYLGYQFTRGHYDHQFEVLLNQDEIVLENTLFIRQLKLQSVDANKPQPMDRQLDVPLAFALDMLRDRDGNIELDVPIKGRRDDPDININSLVNAALGKAVQAGAASYLTLALQPYGAVLIAADYIGGRLSVVQLDSIVYPAGSSALTEQQEQYIEKISRMLVDRPKLHLTVCATANKADKQLLQLGEDDELVSEQVERILVALADLRSKQVKRQLISHGAQSRRLLLCQPSYQPQASSAVTLMM